nr:hypothetical protein CFP56_72062 [Quercus suber]
MSLGIHILTQASLDLLIGVSGCAFRCSASGIRAINHDIRLSEAPHGNLSPPHTESTYSPRSPSRVHRLYPRLQLTLPFTQFLARHGGTVTSGLIALTTDASSASLWREEDVEGMVTPQVSNPNEFPRFNHTSFAVAKEKKAAFPPSSISP